MCFCSFGGIFHVNSRGICEQGQLCCPPVGMSFTSLAHRGPPAESPAGRRSLGTRRGCLGLVPALGKVPSFTTGYDGTCSLERCLRQAAAAPVRCSCFAENFVMTWVLCEMLSPWQVFCPSVFLCFAALGADVDWPLSVEAALRFWSKSHLVVACSSFCVSGFGFIIS